MKPILSLIITVALGYGLFAQTIKDISSEKILRLYIEHDIKDGNYDQLEGIWTGTEEIQIFINKEVIPSKSTPKKYGILKVDNAYKILEVDKGKSGLVISPTQTQGEFLAKINFDGFYSPAFEGVAKFTDADNLRIVMEGSKETIRLMLGKEYGSLTGDTELFSEIKLFKSYPSSYDIETIKTKALKEAPRSGTGFALSSDGLIVTNYHVIDESLTLKVKGVNGDFNTSYSAKIIVSDKNNDLAIIQIDDYRYKNISSIPYAIKSSASDVGENVFVLGYPLRATMGDEIKLTNGIISSKTGFQGDVTSYQISAPVQPGNSGGPLFDKRGNLIGVVNAKHIGAENVSYAIKVNYLKNLIELLPTTPTMNNANTLANLTLADQVKQLNKFVYIIETNR